jgi:hypothetical protein
MIGQPSSPGMCVNWLRLGGVKGALGEAPPCIDMLLAPVYSSMVRKSAKRFSGKIMRKQ